MKVWVVFGCSGDPFSNECNDVKRIFASKESAERYVIGDPFSENFDKVVFKSNPPGVTLYYFMEYPAYKIEEHEMED